MRFSSNALAERQPLSLPFRQRLYVLDLLGLHAETPEVVVALGQVLAVVLDHQEASLQVRFGAGGKPRLMSV